MDIVKLLSFFDEAREINLMGDVLYYALAEARETGYGIGPLKDKRFHLLKSDIFSGCFNTFNIT